MYAYTCQNKFKLKNYQEKKINKFFFGYFIVMFYCLWMNISPHTSFTIYLHIYWYLYIHTRVSVCMMGQTYIFNVNLKRRTEMYACGKWRPLRFILIYSEKSNLEPLMVWCDDFFKNKNKNIFLYTLWCVCITIITLSQCWRTIFYTK